MSTEVISSFATDKIVWSMSAEIQPTDQRARIQGAAPLGVDTPELWLAEKNKKKKQEKISESNSTLSL